MIDFDDLLNSLRRNLPQILGLSVLALIVTGEVAFALVQILPAMRMHNELSSQLAEARQALSPPARDGEIEATLQAQLTAMQETLDEQASAFLSESEVPVILNQWYRYADESGVQIVKIEAARSAPDKAKGTAHEAQSLQVEVSSPTLQLIDFVTRLEEASLPAVVIDHLAIKQGKATGEGSLLTMDLLVYTSPYATGKASITAQP